MSMAGTDPTRILHETRCGYVLVHAQEAGGHLSVNRGRRGCAMRLLFRRDVPEIKNLIAPVIEYALGGSCVPAGQPIYCMLPSYQSWLLPILHALGFVHVTTTALMLKHVAAAVRSPIWQDQRMRPVGRLASTDPSLRLDNLHADKKQTPCKKLE